MVRPAEKPSAHIEVILAGPEQESILANLLELYTYDFSEFHDLEIGADGRFGYSSLPLYWSEPGRYPLLSRIDGELAGLVLVKQGSEVSGNETVWDMAEFFVLRGYRRRGIGTQIAHDVWRRFPGLWEVRVMQSNVSARDFWAHAISTFMGDEIHPAYAGPDRAGRDRAEHDRIEPACIEKDGKRWTLFSFESKPVA